MFDNLRDDKLFYEYSKEKFRKLLRGNYSLLNPKTLTDALTVDLIGMRAGMEVFGKLQTAVFIETGKYAYELKYLVGGSHYFKIKHITD